VGAGGREAPALSEVGDGVAIAPANRGRISQIDRRLGYNVGGPADGARPGEVFHFRLNALQAEATATAPAMSAMDHNQIFPCHPCNTSLFMREGGAEKPPHYPVLVTELRLPLPIATASPKLVGT